MKKALMIVGGFLLLLVAAAFIIPIVFKDDIKAAIDKQLAKTINADVVFDVNKFNVTLFKHFPNLTVEMQDFGVVNHAPFDGQVLFATKDMQVDVNLKQIIFGNQVRIKGIRLVDPIINIHVLKDGRANYDITFPSTDTTTTTADSSKFSFGIDHWEIDNGQITYNDESIPYKLVMKGVNHEGSGDFNQDVFDLTTHTVADSVSTSYDGTEYLTDKHAQVDAVISISENYSKFTFKQNKAMVNDFPLNFDGWFKMNDNSYDMDISFQSPESTFKSLLSIVPGMYAKDFNSIKTDGDLAFSGKVNGTFSDTKMPAFNLNLKVSKAMFQYPDLPTPINNINVDVVIDDKDGNVDHTTIAINKFHLDFGTNPFDATAMIRRIYPTDVDASISAKLNLAELGKMFPVEGLDMRGNYSLNLKAKGVYDSLKKTIPAIDATMVMSDGYIKSKDFPIPLEDLAFNATVKNSSGQLAETDVAVNGFSMTMDKEKFTADLLLHNLDNLHWDLKAKGGVDLERITKIFPIEGTTLKGKLVADIHTQGQMSDLDASRYDKLPTSGKASLSNFKYTSKDLPYDVTLKQAVMDFNPKEINLQKLNGTIGRSDFEVDGTVLNYLGYIFGKNQIIHGKVNFNSTLLDLNQFMTSTDESTASTDSSSYGVIQVPKNIDFTLQSQIKTVKMMDYTMTDAKGSIIVKNGIANLKGLQFNLLDGAFAVDGTYDPRQIKHPKYDFDLKIDHLSIKSAASSFSIVQKFVPVAGLASGSFSTDFKIKGELLPTLMPNMNKVDGGGLVKIAQAQLTGSKVVSSITSLTKLDDTDEVTLKDVLMTATIKDGRFSVKPFDVSFGSYKTTVDGSTGLDGSIAYNLKMNVPAGKLGSQFNGLVSQYSGTSQTTNPNSMVPLKIGLGGTMAKPEPKLIMDEQKKQVTNAVKNAAEEKAKDEASNLAKGTKAEDVVNDLIGSKKDSTAKSGSPTTSNPTPAQDANKQLQQQKQEATQKAADKINNLLKHK